MASLDAVEEIRERINLIDVVSRYVSLKRSGNRHWGLCPFHAEKTSSFSVVEDQGFFYCFGCHASGDLFTFVQRIEKIDFREALERLSGEAGVELERDPAARTKREGRERLLELNARAAAYYVRCLEHERTGASARGYLAARGIGAEAITTFRIGFSPSEGLARALRKAKAHIEDAVSVGLVGRRGEQWTDRFRDRIMFPITDLSGRTIAFGGRLLGDGNGPKYLNSPESQVFHKRQALFGLAAARETIREKDAVVVVEGYLDVIALSQAGIRNVVAPLGTALTAEQIRLLRRFTDRVVVLFDGDAAGEAAASRSFPVFVEASLFAEAVFLPPGHDPDSFVRESGADALEEKLANPTPLVDHYLGTLAPPGSPLTVRRDGGDQVGELVSKCSDPTFAGLLAHRAAEMLGVSEQQILERGQRARRRPPDPRPGPSEEAPETPREAPALRLTASEWMLIELLLVQPELRPEVPADTGAILSSDEARSLLERARTEGTEARELLDELPVPSRRRVAQALGGEEALYPEPRKMLRDCLEGLERERAEAASHALNRAIKTAEAAGDDERVRELLREKGPLAASARRAPRT